VIYSKVFPYIQEQNCGEGVYELEDHFVEEALSLNLLPKFGPEKKNSSCSQSHVRKCLNWIHIFLFLVPPPPFKGTKQNTIRVTKRANVKLPYHKGFVLAYLVEKKILFIHYVVE
jgi:hypothetical protein